MRSVARSTDMPAIYGAPPAWQCGRGPIAKRSVVSNPNFMTVDRIPLHRPDIGDEEIAAVSAVLRSGWLTTGAECRAFEEELATFTGAQHAVAVNSCTAALHLALEATGLQRSDAVLVPTLTFAATAEVVAYFGATPVLVDVEPDTLCLDAAAAARLLDERTAWRRVHAILPVHYAGQMADVDAIARLAHRWELRVIEDAAHALPAFARDPEGHWRTIGTTSEVTCFSFYANKTITTGEGGMMVTDSPELAARARRMSLHGLSADAWQRYGASGSWRYQIVAPGFKYNLTDLAAALGRVQLRKATALWERRTLLAARYAELFAGVDELELPQVREDRRSSWHLYALRLNLDRLSIDRAQFIDELQRLGIGASVHWMPLHLHPYYRDTFGYRQGDFPVADREWPRLVSLPIFPSMTEAEQQRVADAVIGVARRHHRRAVA
jgi:perosamine synthetase